MSNFFNLFFKKHTLTSQVKIKSGLHLRPCALLAKNANSFKSTLTLSANNKNVNMKNLNDLLTLGLEFEDNFILNAQGIDAQEALATLSTLLESFKEEVTQTDTLQHRKYISSSLKSEVIHKGIAMAEPFFYHNELRVHDEKFSDAIERVAQELKEIKNDIFEAQFAILKSIQAKSFDEFEKIIDTHIKEISQSTNNAKADDYRDIKNRVLKSSLKPKIPNRPFILVAESLLPSDIEYLSKSNIVGAILKEISVRSHVAMLLRTFDIPTLRVDIDLSLLKDNFIVDADNEIVIIEPKSEDIELAREAIQKRDKLKKSVYSKSAVCAMTKNNETIKVLANVHNIASAKEAKEFGCEGIGLLRSEFIFKEKKPALEEQIRFYTEIFALFDDVCVRTLDVGGDKKLPYITIEDEANPFLGIRGIRLLQTHRDIISEQLRAILIAANDKVIKIMFPMVATPQEFIEAKALAVALAKKEDIKIDNIQFGIMIEVPSVLFVLEEFDKVVDFYSIGTNDLAQYLFAIDRTHKTLQINDTEDVIYRAITKIARETTKPLSICGELASEPENIKKLIECGLKTLSVTPKMIPEIKEKIRDV
ncbi:MAG: HPr family phosphocarrier protein [Campylobacterales bacterium]|nr:HPr family phosphocarrier protein [Campylobacterales bacterium]